ncbi:MAG: hypothetical protein IPM54_30220 [Polyangiaceae bacterium]|nr:hypothetical protein [Polyangiaceae bacterium]
MLGSNGHYGHRNILNAYAGVPVGTPIPGHVQHGWNYDLGSAISQVNCARPCPFFLWSARNLRNCRKAGLADRVEPLGSPFLYLPPAKEVEPVARSLLVMPFHGWEKERIQQDFQEYAQAIRDISKDFGKITVCLYWHDMQFAEYRRPFEELGAEVLTVGHRDNNPRFLFDMRDLMLRCEYVTANRVQTAAFYALSLGRKFFVHGPPTGLDGSIDRSGELFHAWQKQEFPRLFWDKFEGMCHKSIGDEELGLEFKRDRDELQELFAWGPERSGELRRRTEAYRTRIITENRAAALKQLQERVTRLLPPFLRAYVKRGD